MFMIFQMLGPSPFFARLGYDIYDQHLALKGRGKPMQHPEPSRTLPVAYRRRGTTIGDVGMFTPSGGFDYMFNICLPADDPTNQQGLPEGFSPLAPPLHPSDIHIRTEFNQNTYLASASVEKSYSSNQYVYLSLIDDKNDAWRMQRNCVQILCL
jgi:hypothetical protein